MKSILISIKPQWIEKILNGEKTIEIRKTKPNIELPCKAYIYCSYSKKPMKDLCCYSLNTGNYKLMNKEEYDKDFAFSVNGSVVAEFMLNKIETLWQNNKNKTSTAIVVDKAIFEKQTCMTWEQYCEYHKCKNGKYPNSYAWHIDDLKVYDKPKELSEFSVCKAKIDCGYGNYNIYNKILQRPPQSWCYVESLEDE